MIKRWPLLVAVVLGLAALAYEWNEAREREASANLRARIAHLRMFAANVDSLALTVRVSVIPSYDALVANLAELRHMSRELEPDLPPELAAEQDAFARLLARRTELVETLKAKRSASRNTERYLVGYAESPEADPEVMRRLLAFELVPDDERGEALNALAVKDPTLARHLKLKSSGRVELDNMVLDVAREDLASSAARLEENLSTREADADARRRAVHVAILSAMVILLLLEISRGSADLARA